MNGVDLNLADATQAWYNKDHTHTHTQYASELYPEGGLTVVTPVMFSYKRNHAGVIS